MPPDPCPTCGHLEGHDARWHAMDSRMLAVERAVVEDAITRNRRIARMEMLIAEVARGTQDAPGGPLGGAEAAEGASG